jgi:hypothetical protein
MTEPETPSTVRPERPRFQFSLRTLLLLFVVLGSSLAVFGAWGIVVFVLVAGLAVGICQAESLSSPSFVILAALWLICFLVVLSLPFAIVARESSRRSWCRNQVGNVALAMLGYQDKTGHLPPAFVADKSGTPMYSWRVLLLPYLDESAMYAAYNFAEPWDSPINKKLLTTGMRIYLCPSDNAAADSTSYVAVVGSGAAWAAENPRKLTDLGNEPSHTILLIEVANSGIAWSEPRDFSLDTLNVSDSKSPPMTLASHRVGHSEFFFIYDAGTGIHVAMADGTAHFLRTDCLSSEDLRKVLAVGGCKNVAGGPHVALDEEERHPNWPNIAALAVWLLSVGTLLVLAVRSRKMRMTVGG